MNEQDRCAADVSNADVVFAVTRDAAAGAVQVTGAAVAGLATGLTRGFCWLTRRAAGSAAGSQVYKKAVAKAAQAWGAANSAVEERKRQLREARREP